MNKDEIIEASCHLGAATRRYQERLDDVSKMPDDEGTREDKKYLMEYWQSRIDSAGRIMSLLSKLYSD